MYLQLILRMYLQLILRMYLQLILRMYLQLILRMYLHLILSEIVIFLLIHIFITGKLFYMLSVTIILHFINFSIHLFFISSSPDQTQTFYVNFLYISCNTLTYICMIFLFLLFSL